jgi:hypothetical protein
MNLHGRIPVDPLDEDRVVRIERAVVVGYADAMSRGQRASSRWLLPVLASAAAVAVVAAVAVWRLPAQPGAPAIAAPVRVEATPAGSHVELGDAAIDAELGAAFVVTRPAGSVLIALDRGLVELAVESRAGKAPLIVRAGDVDVVVVGTRFSVERGAEVTVQVTEGVVRVARGGDEVRVAAGQRWSAPAQIAARTPMPQPTAIAVAAAGTSPDPAGTIKSGAIETTDRGTGPELRDHDPVVPTTSDDRVRSDGDGGSGGRRTTQAGSALDPRPVTTTQKLPRTQVSPPYDVGVTGDAALAIYRNMMSGNGDEARRGYYGVAYLLWKARRTGEALRQLDAYVTRFEKGAELDDVLWLRIKLACATVDSRCRAYAATYVADFPGTGRAELANQLTHELE